ncbi:MAG: PQQ-dependent sugar dehydrogenase [Lewinellaceae bacterium]|nr:PQQ-dependent sugar dehydrogenase [Lewinellaceae bacterium]
MRSLFLLAFLFFGRTIFSQPALSLELYASGFDLPVDIAHAGDERLFIVEKAGRIRIIDGGGVILAQPFLDIDSRVNSQASERGLLGLAFHPDYAGTGYFYVNYTNNSGDTRISRFSVLPDNPNRADPNSERILLEVDQPFSNHNAGDLNFGPDGYLYFGLGDGGSANDPGNRAQNRQNLLGKMLRIDVDNGNPYSIPEDNPFADDDFTLDEIWAIGLRNPWRFSFDRLTGEMWIGDVGQDTWEEVNHQLPGSAGGQNYGWRCYEGQESFNPNGCSSPGEYTFPVHTYRNTSSIGCSITGGYVYRGSEYPDMYGYYLFTDYCSGRFWSLSPDGQGGWQEAELANLANNQFVTFGEDKGGELYVAAISDGDIFRLTAPCVSPDAPAVSGDGLACGPDQPALLEATAAPGGHDYAWYRNGILVALGGSQTYQATEGGLYTVAFWADSPEGCNSAPSAGFEVVGPDFPEELISADGAQLSAPAGLAAYQWFLNGEPIEGAVSDSYIALENGDYAVQATDANGCTRTSETVMLVVNATAAEVGLEKLALAPNPFREGFDLRLSVREPGELRIWLATTDGKFLLEETQYVSRQWEKWISISEMPSGTYVFGVERNGKTIVRKVIKQ